jgi:hypothetical protein
VLPPLLAALPLAVGPGLLDLGPSNTSARHPGAGPLATLGVGSDAPSQASGAISVRKRTRGEDKSVSALGQTLRV